MHYNPYAIARFLFAGALVASVISLLLWPSLGWLSACMGWSMVLIYENVRRQLFRVLIQLREDGLISVVERDDIDVNDGQ